MLGRHPHVLRCPHQRHRRCVVARIKEVIRYLEGHSPLPQQTHLRRPLYGGLNGMSFHKNDRKIQSKKGKSFPGELAHSDELFNQAVASALREEFGGGPSAVKTVARLTEANERAVRNWFEGSNGPSGRS